MSCIVCHVERIVILLSMAHCEPRQMYHRTKLSKRLLERAKDAFPELTTTETRTVYTCLKTLLGRYVKNMLHARATFPLMRALIPSIFKTESFGAIPIHFFQLRRLFSNHEDQEVAEYADELFRKTRAELRADKKKRENKENINPSQNTQPFAENGTTGNETCDPPLAIRSNADFGART